MNRRSFLQQSVFVATGAAIAGSPRLLRGAAPERKVGTPAAEQRPEHAPLANSFSVSMNCYGWGNFDVAQCLEQIKKTPLRSLELPAAVFRPGSFVPEIMLDEPVAGRYGWKYSVPSLKALLAKDGFRAESVDVFGFWKGKKAAEIIKRRVDFAAELGAETIVFGVGQATDDQTRRYLYALMRDVADYAAPKKVRLALEIHGGIMGNSKEILRTMAEVHRPNVGVNFDTGNIFHYNRQCDLRAELEAVAGHVFHVHLKDIILGKSPRKDVNPPLGMGTVDFRIVFDVLHAAGFHGPFAFEIETLNGFTKSDNIADYHADLLRSIEHLRSIGQWSFAK